MEVRRRGGARVCATMPPWTTTSTDSPRVGGADVVDRRQAAPGEQRVVVLVARGPPAGLEVPRPALLDLGAGVALATRRRRARAAAGRAHDRDDRGASAMISAVRRARTRSDDQTASTASTWCAASAACCSPERRQRWVGLPLPAPVGVPRGLAVADEQQRGSGAVRLDAAPLIACSTRRKPSAERCPAREPGSCSRASPRPAPVPGGSQLPLDRPCRDRASGSRVAEQRFDLAVDGVGDVDEHVGVRRRHHVHLARDPRPRSPRRAAPDARRGCAASGYTAASVAVTAGEVVGMARVDALVVAIGRLAEHPLRAHATDHARDVAPQIERRRPDARPGSRGT